MSIVTDNAKIVNSNNKTFDNDEVIKWSVKKKQSRIMSAKMYRAGLRDRAARMYQCSDYITERINPQTGEVITDTAQLCKDRLCPICNWRLSLRRFTEMMAVLNVLKEDIIKYDYKVAFLTLTVKNVELPDLRKCIDTYAKAWHNMSRREIFRGVVGWSRSLEITYNREKNTYHPHYHIILIWEKEAYTEMAGKIMQQAWKHAYKCDYDPIIDIREAYTKNDVPTDNTEAVVKAAVEAFKYSVKDKALKEIPQKDLYKFAEAIKGVRMVSYGKAIKELRKALGFRNDDTAQPLDVPAYDDNLVISVMRWNGTAYKKSSLENLPWNIAKSKLEKEIEAAGSDE